MREIDWYSYSKDPKGEPNARGCFVFRSFLHEATRYLFDFDVCPSTHGWQQYDTDNDAWNYGTWVNPELRLLVSFAEGDVTIVSGPTEEAFLAEIAQLRSSVPGSFDPPV